MANNLQSFTPEEQIRRAFDREQIKNVFAKHCYCHLALRHDLEMEKIWAHNAPNVSWGFPTGFQVGRDTVWDFYVKPNPGQSGGSQCLPYAYTDDSAD